MVVETRRPYSDTNEKQRQKRNMRLAGVAIVLIAGLATVTLTSAFAGQVRFVRLSHSAVGAISVQNDDGRCFDIMISSGAASCCRCSFVPVSCAARPEGSPKSTECAVVRRSSSRPRIRRSEHGRASSSGRPPAGRPCRRRRCTSARRASCSASRSCRSRYATPPPPRSYAPLGYRLILSEREWRCHC